MSTFPVTSTEWSDRGGAILYRMEIPSGHPAGATGAWLGPVNVELRKTAFTVSHSPSTVDVRRISVFGTFDGPSIPAEQRDWFVVRGDTASGVEGLNNSLLAVTLGGAITILTPARAYRFKVSGGEAASDPVLLRVMSMGR